MLPIIQKLHTEGKSVRQIEAELKSQGYKVSKSSVSNYLKEQKNANIIEEEIENIDYSQDIDNDEPVMLL